MECGHRPLSRSIVAAVLGGLAVLLASGLTGCGRQTEAPPATKPDSGPPSVTLSPQQLQVIRVAPLAEQDFAPTIAAVGSIDFDANHTVPVFSPYPGKIIAAFVQAGDTVTKGQPLFSVESPDLIAAGATLVSAEATEAANAKALARARTLHETQGISDQTLEAAIAAEAGSQASLQAARAAIAVFGKTPGEIAALARQHRADAALVVRSPLSGTVTARNAALGLLVQPGNAPAPFTVGNTDTMWMLANPAEADSARLHIGQAIAVRVVALPGRELVGRIETIGASVDLATHTVPVRASVANPGHVLKAGMQASVIIHTGAVVRGLGLPAEGVVREGDGTLTAWVTRDQRHFVQHTITVGPTQDGMMEVLSGLKAGDQVVTKGSVYLDNMLAATPDDD